MSIQYPDIHVQLSGEDGNAFFIMGRVTGAMKAAGVPKAERDAFAEKVFACPSYNAVLQLVMRTVSVS